MPDDVSPDQRREIKGRMKELNDHELLRIVALEESEYLPEAMEIAREELEIRKVKVLDASEYYSQFPDENPFAGFCKSCLEQTTAEGPEYLGRMGPVSYCLRGFDHPCEACGSVLVTKWFFIAFFPVRKMEKYRMLEGSPEVYRRVKERDAEPGDARDGQRIP